MEHEYWYRARANVHTMAYDIWTDDWFRTAPRFELLFDEYRVLKHTPCGVQLEVDYRSRFVNRSWNKRFAAPTREEAVEDLRHRTHRRQKIVTRQLRDTEIILENLNARIQLQPHAGDHLPGINQGIQ
jgi:hypothetical protein